MQNLLPIQSSLSFFRQVFQIILTKRNRYFHQYMSSRTTGSTSAKPSDITIEEKYTFFGLVIQMGHDQRHSLKDYWSRKEQYCTPFYSNVMARDRFFHILRFFILKTMTTLQTMTAPTTTDFGKYERFLTY